MPTRLPSTRKLTSLNRRQRKKLRVGELQEFVFQVQIYFNRALDEVTFDSFLDDFIEVIECRSLSLGGFVGLLPIRETDGIISTWGRVSTTDEGRRAVQDWLMQYPEVANANTGALIDDCYGYN